MENKKLRVCFISSSGGHLEQLLTLKPLMKEFDSYIVTEKCGYQVNSDGIPVEYVKQINRSDKTFLLKFIYNVIKSFSIFVRYRPQVIVSTGAMATIPMMVFTKIFHGRVIYIESYAKINSPNLSGKISYKFASEFFVQWKSMKKYYPDAKYVGGIY